MSTRVGNADPLTGGSFEVGVGVSSNAIVGVGVTVIVTEGSTPIEVVGVAGGGEVVIVAEGVAIPSTCVPLLRTSNVFVIATGFFALSVLVTVILCFPIPSGSRGVKRQIPSLFTTTLCVFGWVIPMMSVTDVPGIPVP